MKPFPPGTFSKTSTPFDEKPMIADPERCAGCGSERLIPQDGKLLCQVCDAQELDSTNVNLSKDQVRSIVQRIEWALGEITHHRTTALRVLNGVLHDLKAGL